ncbi:MAG: DNA-binding protein [Candidatus Methanoplasma sp.]|jgi:predicted DNA-binding protein with PD1-like motif|nr:DNA-binding protein [Candidatus Methanoplasma sp.]
MRSLEMGKGRTFVLRLETGNVLHEVVERFSKENNIKSAFLIAVGGIGEGSRMTVGPEVPYDDGIIPIIHTLDAPHELTASGTIFQDEDGEPIMHMHGSAGREGKAVTGCLRAGVIAWLVLEVVLVEMVGEGAIRKKDEATGMKILRL